ncbi:putative Mitochondrial transcription termination factor family protein [Hibiscus syriacus]|uniref:Mitochondrial transcription termination factor family protein n=1 Tax=Hibiscus syriacus TaxID=106335 RepID=A0A6A3AFG2_HIBSY|nr:putative Mitochondrial transcription termination factor family protein [Hibiscus syriacus]
MASFKVFLCVFLHALFLVSSSGTRLFHPFLTADSTMGTDSKSQYKASTYNGMETISRHFGSKRFSGMKLLPLAVAAGEHLEADFAESKRALVEEGREAIKASIQRNGGEPFESKRTSPGGPDPHHH